jgi:hypothetical protein
LDVSGWAIWPDLTRWRCNTRLIDIYTSLGICVITQVEKYLEELASESSTSFLLSKLRSSIILSHGSDRLNSISLCSIYICIRF